MIELVEGYIAYLNYLFKYYSDFFYSINYYDNDIIYKLIAVAIILSYALIYLISANITKHISIEDSNENDNTNNNNNRIEIDQSNLLQIRPKAITPKKIPYYIDTSDNLHEEFKTPDKSELLSIDKNEYFNIDDFNETLRNQGFRLLKWKNGTSSEKILRLNSKGSLYWNKSKGGLFSKSKPWNILDVFRIFQCDSKPGEYIRYIIQTKSKVYNISGLTIDEDISHIVKGLKLLQIYANDDDSYLSSIISKHPITPRSNTKIAPINE